MQVLGKLWIIRLSFIRLYITMGLNKIADLIELSSFLSEIPTDAYILLSQILIGCSLLRQEYYELIG